MIGEPRRWIKGAKMGRKDIYVVATRCIQHLPLIAHGAAGAMVCDMDAYAYTAYNCRWIFAGQIQFTLQKQWIFAGQIQFTLQKQMNAK
jgi:hypothetical protein